MPYLDVDKIADRIADGIADGIVKSLFTNGDRRKAYRLVLELSGGKDGGGWCAGAVKDVIVMALRKSGH